MRRFLALILFASICSADGGMGPGPGVKGYAGSGGTPAEVQSVTGTWVNTSTTATASFGSLPTSTHSVIVEVVGYATGSTATSVTDNQANCAGAGYTKIAALMGTATQAESEMWWCHAVGSSSGTFTVTATFGTSIHAQVRAIEVSNISAVDKSGSSNTSGTTTPNVTTSGANANANDFVTAVLCEGYNGSDPTTTYPPSSGYTDLGFNNGWGVGWVDNDAGYKVVSAIETSSASWTIINDGQDVAMIVASFH